MIIKKENIVERKIHDTYFLIDISDKYLDDKCHLYEINEIGDFIWKQLGMSDTVSDIANALIELVSEEVDYYEVYKDIKDFIDILINENYLEVIDGGN